MGSTRPISEGKQVAVAHSILKSGGTVETAAETAQVSRRQLHRLFLRHLGMGPKSLADLERLHSSAEERSVRQRGARAWVQRPSTSDKELATAAGRNAGSICP
jgi:methylphosphotriester-DNA--protein-cysteine methyltransferase